MNLKTFFKNFLCGAMIGIAAIIPGVSGGTVAVLLNIYDDFVGAVSGLFKNFRRNILFLLPILLGVVAGIGAMYFPLEYALDKAPLPTVLLFAGLMVGSFPKLFKDGISYGFKKIDILSAVIPFVVVVGICFIPSLSNSVDLGVDMPVWQYFVLILMGILASCALVVPGVSGSLVLLILGYYQPIIETIGGLAVNFGHSLAVLALFALGIVAGFFIISKIMKVLLNKFPRGTHWAIIGFVVGSIPAIFISFADNFPDASYDTAQIVVGVVLCILGIIFTYCITAFAEAKQKKAAEIEENGGDENN